MFYSHSVRSCLLEVSVESVSNHDLFVSAFCFRDLLEYRICVICKMGHYTVLNQGIIQEFNLGIDSHVSITNFAAGGFGRVLFCYMHF